MPAARAATRRPGRRAVVRHLGLATVVLAVAAAVTALYRLGTPHGFFDLKIYMTAMRWWADGNPLYDYEQPDLLQGRLYFTYPPFAALLLRPFAELPLDVTIVIFTALTVAAVVVTTWWLVAPLARRRGWPVWFPVAVAAGLALGVESTRETIGFGQINMLLVVLILADLLIAVPRGSRWAGVGVGLATAIKLYPGIFIVYLLVARRWRTAAVASATAAGATLLAAALAPGDSWRFWSHELWETDRVGRPDYTGNQSLFGLLSRLTVPEKPESLIWLLLAVAIAGYGLWRAGRAARAGDELAGLALTGLVGALISPITWTHHVYWFVPALVLLVDAALRPPAGSPAGTDPGSPAGPGLGSPAAPGRGSPAAPDPGSPAGPGAGPPARPNARRRPALLALAAVGYVAITYGVVSYYDWGIAVEPTDSPAEFLLRNLYVLLALVLLVALPIRRTAPPPAAAMPFAASGRRGRGAAGTGDGHRRDR